MKVYVSLFVLLLFISCSTSKMTIDEHNPTDIANTSWSGTIPCADCEGIAVQFKFNEDNTYRQTYLYLGKNVSPFIDSGRWAVDRNGLISLMENTQHTSYLKIVGDHLQMLGTNKKAIESPLKDMYFLKRMEGEEHAAVYNEKMMSGTDFTASGNEPFWGLDIDFETNMSFANADGFELNVPFVKSDPQPSENTITYFSKTSNGSIAVVIRREKCTNSMSGALSNYSVKVEVTDEKGVVKPYQGCGRFLGNARLNNLWKLKEIGEIPNDTMIIQQAPSIQFRVEEGMVAGFSGCNRFHGNMEIIGDSILFKQLASTLMACPEPLMQLEDKFMQAISSQKLHFIISDNLLYLGEGANRLVFETGE